MYGLSLFPTGCEYGDHWADYCDQNVKPPKVADQCARYESQCCATCNKFKENGFAGILNPYANMMLITIL